MKDDPVQSWMWTKEEIDGGILEKVTEAEAMKYLSNTRENLISSYKNIPTFFPIS
jgi:hypothetical protein